MRTITLLLAVLFTTMFIFGMHTDSYAAQNEDPQVIIIDGDNSTPIQSYNGTVVEAQQRVYKRAKLNARGGMIADRAKRYIGVPYVWGGTSEAGFDCSGFVKSVYADNGINITRLADEQYYNGQRIDVKDLDVGDLVFFETYTAGISHVGIYLGDNKFIHASSSRGVTIDSLNSPYFKARFRGACRYDGKPLR